MNKVILILALVLVVNASHGEAPSQEELTLAERQQIAWAIQILLNYNILIPTENRCVEFKPGIFQRLQNEGLLRKGNSTMMSICIGSSN